MRMLSSTFFLLSIAALAAAVPIANPAEGGHANHPDCYCKSDDGVQANRKCASKPNKTCPNVGTPCIGADGDGKYKDCPRV